MLLIIAYIVLVLILIQHKKVNIYDIVPIHVIEFIWQYAFRYLNNTNSHKCTIIICIYIHIARWLLKQGFTYIFQT